MSPLSLETPTIRVPGLLTDDALQEQLKTFKQNFNGGATQAPTAAYDMADKVQADFFDAPVRNTLRAASALTPLPLSTPMRLAADAMSSGPAQPSPQQKAIDVRSDILSNDSVKGISSYLLGGPLGYLAREGGALDAAGTLTPEESDAAQADRQKDAGAYEAAVKRTAETRAKLRGLTDEEATAMGLPLQPGMDAQSEQEQRQVLAQQDADRIKNAEAKTAEAKVEKPTQTWWLNAIRSFYTGQNSMYTGIGKGAAIGLWELPGEMAGIREAGRSDLRAWFDTVDATMKKVLPPDHAQAGDFVNQLSQGAGSMVGFMVGGYLASELGLPAKASTMLVGATSGGDQQYEDAEKFHAGGVQRLISYLAGAGLGMTEAIPINRALARLETATGGVVSRALQTTGAPALEEFIQELGQNLGQDVVAKAIYDEQRKLDWKSYLQAAAVGGVLGGLGGSAAETLARSGVINAPHGTDEKQPAAKATDDGAQTDFLHTLMNDAQVNFDDLTAEHADAPVEGDLGPAEYVRVDDGADQANVTDDAMVSLAARASGPDFAQLLADARSRLADRKVTADTLAGPGTPVKFIGDNGRSALAGPDVSNSGKFRVTYFDEKGPSNHVEHDTLYDAAYSALQEGFTPVTKTSTRAAPEPTLNLDGKELTTFAQRAPKSEAFNNWFGDSKVVDAAGEPLVVYHGSRADVKEFRVPQDLAGNKRAVYFTPDAGTASLYATGGPGGNVTPVYLMSSNMQTVDFAGKSSVDGMGREQIVRKARAAGYDGVLLKNTLDTGSVHDQYAVFEPTQIKSVNNAGNFDPNNSDILAATSSNRGGYAAEQQRAQAGIAGQPAAGTGSIGLREIADNFTKLLGITVRQGRFTLKGAEGQFSAKSGVVRLKSPNDLSTLIHEGAHTLEVNATGPLRAFVNANKTVFQTAARKLYGGDVEKMGVAERVSEGFAEFFRVYTLNRRYAEINYPQLTQDFDAFFAQHDPKLRNGLQLIGDQYAAWLQLPSSALVRNMVVSGKQTTGINAAIEEARKQGVGNWFREFANRIFSGAINRNNDLNNLVADILNVAQENRGKALDLKRADDPRVLIRMATNVGNRAMVQITDGVMPHRSTDPTTAGLRAVLLRYHGKGADENLSAIDEERQRDFAAYTVSLRGIDEYSRFAQGLIERPPLAATLGDLQTTVKEMEAKYGADFIEAARMVHEYSMGLWEKGYQAGLIDEDTYNEGQMRGFYVPLQRDLSDKEITQSGISASAARAGRSIVKRFRGSDRDIIDPMDALMQKTFSLEKVIAENEVKKALAKLADQAGQVGALVERVPAHRLMGQQFNIQEVARQLTKDPSVSATDAQDLLTILETAIDEGNRIALFRSQQAVAGGENIVFFWENGKLAALQVKDGDVGTDIINTLNAVGTETVPLLVDLISYPSAAFRAAVTSWPDFLLVNFIRDQMSAFVLTEGYKPFVTGLRGVSDEIRQGDWARQYNAAMGTMGGMNTSTLHQARVNVDIAALRNKGYIARVFGEDGIKGKIGGLARLTELTETGTRLGIYRTAYDRAKADGLTDWEASVEAGYIATDYIDFGLHGNRMLAWRRLVPFLNAQLQGLYKMMRTLGGDEVRQRRGLRFALSAFFKDINGLELSRTEQQAIRVGRKAWLKMASLGIIGAALQAVFKDDPDYQDASEYLRTTGWIIPIGNGEIFYIPKPFELAMVSNIVERGMEMASGDKEAKWRMMRGMAMNLSPPTNPPAIQAIVEQAANWDSFSGREIVPDYMRALEPELQYNHYTTQFAKRLGSMFGWSPMRIDHVMSAFGASAYRDLTQLYNMTDPSRPASDKTDWPITRRFVRDARRGAVSAQDFWKFASTVDGSLRRAELTYKNYIEAGRDNAAQSYLSTLDPDERAYALLNTHFKADFKRLNPTYRARQLTTIVSAMRRELYSDLGVENSGPGGATDPFMLSAKEKADVDTLLSEYARREVRNSLVFMKAPGWANKKPLPTEPTIEMMRATQPLVAEEFERRIKKAKVYNAETVQEYWPEVRDRLLSDGSDAFLKDIQTIAKVMR